jgi:hypothetical protein
MTTAESLNYARQLIPVQARDYLASAQPCGFDAASRQRAARAQQHVEHGTAGAGHDAAEGLTEVHMSREMVM